MLNKTEEPTFSIKYYDQNGAELTERSKMKEIHTMRVTLNMQHLLDNPAGSMLIRGFFDERTEEALRIWKMLLDERKESRILKPSQAGLNLVS